MNILVLLVAGAFLSCLILTPALRQIAIRHGIFDMPDRERKLHRKPIPRIGGVAVMLTYFASFAVLQLLHLQNDSLAFATKLMPGVLVMFLVGLTDDLIGLHPYHKFAGQFLAAFLVCGYGLRIQSLAGYDLGGVPGTLLTVLWLVGCTNAFNLIDGMDGLATGIALCSTMGAIFATMQLGNDNPLLAGAPLIGGLLAFMVYNFTPASIFLGDSGSLSIGFLVACFAVSWLQGVSTISGLAGPLMTSVVPLLDTSVAVARRIIKGQSIFQADRSHIHHRLLDRGMPTGRVASYLYGVSALAGLLAVGQTRSSSTGSTGLVILFCIGVVAGIRYLNYQEFRVLAQVLRESHISSIVQTRLSLRAFDENVQRASDPQQCWRALAALGQELGVCRLTLCLAGQNFEEESDGTTTGYWNLNVPLSANEYVTVCYRVNHKRATALTGLMANHLHRALSTKAEEFCHYSRQSMERPPSSTGTYVEALH